MNREIHTPHKQSGAILVVGLVMLLVLTILGVSTMNTASLELNMAGNDQFQENAFQLAETGIDVPISQINAGAGVPAPLNPGACPPFANLPVGQAFGTVSTRTCFTGDIPDMSGGSSFGKIRQYHYATESRGVARGQASSWHHQGLFILGPDGI